MSSESSFGCLSWVSSETLNTGGAGIFGTFSCSWYPFPPIIFYLPALTWIFCIAVLHLVIPCSVDISVRPFLKGNRMTVVLKVRVDVGLGGLEGDEDTEYERRMNKKDLHCFLSCSINSGPS